MLLCNNKWRVGTAHLFSPEWRDMSLPPARFHRLGVRRSLMINFVVKIPDAVTRPSYPLLINFQCRSRSAINSTR